MSNLKGISFIPDSISPCDVLCVSLVQVVEDVEASFIGSARMLSLYVMSRVVFHFSG